MNDNDNINDFLNFNSLCEKLFYIDSSNKINCISSNICPGEYPYLYNNNQCNNCPYIYQNECYKSCPENTCVNNSDPNLFICKKNTNPNINIYNNLCIDNLGSLVNQFINQDSQLNIINSVNNVNIYSYSSKMDFSSLIAKNNKLIYINIDEYIEELVSQNIIEKGTELQIICIQSPSKLSNSLRDNFCFEIYTKDGRKIAAADLSTFNNTKIEVSFPLNNLDLIKIDQAKSLADQGYDIFNKSDPFYYDYCLAAYLNDSDIVIKDRQQDIFPNNITLCPDDCEYDGVDYDTQRINCNCDLSTSLNENEPEEDSSDFFAEEVESNFFMYLLGNINYKIVLCYEHLFDINNYILNYGLYVSGIIVISFIVFSFTFFFIGDKKIRNEFYQKEPKQKKN